METLIQDIRYAVRTLRKNPGFALVAVLALTLGIGANTAIFTVLNAVLLKPLPYPDSRRLIFLSERAPQLEGMSISYPNFLDWRQQNNVFEHIGVYRREAFTLSMHDQPEQIVGAMVSADLFSALKVKAALGQLFSAEEDRPGGEPVVLLSYGLWLRGFGADPGIVGLKLNLSGKPYTVIGVMDADYAFPSRAEFWIPVGLRYSDPGWQSRGNHPGLYGIARMRSGITIEQARAEMDTIATRLEQQYPDSNSGARVSVNTMLDTFVRDIRPVLLVLVGDVAFVLLIACANVANLLLSRAAVRRKEVAIRGALGASRLRLVRQLLTESVLLAFAGSVLGLALALVGVKAIVAVSPNDIPRSREIGLDWRVLGFTLGIALLTGIVFGIVPALQASRSAMSETLKDGGRGSTGGLRQRLRRVLVVAEVALSLILLIGAGLMIRSFYRVDPGFDVSNLLSVEVKLPRAKYPDAPSRVAFYRQLVERVASLPGVQASGIATGLPLGNNGNQTSFRVVGQPEPAPGHVPLTEVVYVSSDYFKAMSIPLIEGRTFDDHDTKDAPPVMIIDDSFAKRYWPGEDAIGKQVKFDSDAPPTTVVGIAGRVRMEGLDNDSGRVQAYFPSTATSWDNMTVVAKTSANPTSLTGAIRQAVISMDPDQPIYNVRTVEQIRDESVAPRRLNMLLFGVFAAAALLLAVVGIYGVMSYSVAQRTHEIGIRMALGANHKDVLKLVLGQGIVLALTGVAIGLVGALIVTRWMQSLLFSVSPLDPITFAAISFTMIAAALLACFVPARRALKVDPLTALRYE